MKKKKLIIVEEKEGKLFDENDFHLILSETEENIIQIILLFCFGGQFYYIKK